MYMCVIELENHCSIMYLNMGDLKVLSLNARGIRGDKRYRWLKDKKNIIFAYCKKRIVLIILCHNLPEVGLVKYFTVPQCT